MSRTEDRPMKRRRMRLVCRMIGTWVVTAVTLSLFWPIRPRLTLGENGQLSVVAVSDDGKNSITRGNERLEATYRGSAGPSTSVRRCRLGDFDFERVFVSVLSEFCKRRDRSTFFRSGLDLFCELGISTVVYGSTLT